MSPTYTSPSLGLQDQAARRAVLVGSFLFWAFGWGVAASIDAHTLEWYVGLAVGPIVCLICAVGHLVAWRKAAWVLVGTQIMAVAVLGWRLQAEPTNLLLNLVVCVCFSGWILGTRAAAIVALLSTALIAVLSARGYFTWVQWLGVFYTMCFVLGVVYLGHRRFDLQLRKQQVALDELQAHKRQLSLLYQAVEQSPDSVLVVDLQGHVRYANAAFERQSGYVRDEVLGKRSVEVSATGLSDEMQQAMRASLAQGQVWRSMLQNQRKDGSMVTESVSISPVYEDGQLTNFVEIKQDVTERMQAEERISFLQNFDTLTQLPNRYALLSKLEHLLLQSRLRKGGQRKSRSTWHAMLQIDLDRFKKFNDARGTAWSDALLQALALRLRSLVPETAFLARTTGDQFAVVLEHAGETRQASRLQAYALATDLQQALDHVEVMHEGSERVPITCGIGFTVFPFVEPGRKQDAAEHIMRRSSVALNQAKAQGLGKIHAYSEATSESAQRSLKLEKDLHTALQSNQLLLYVQPQVNMYGKVVSAEALLRWRHPEEGLVSPGEFIPIAEESGLIVPLGDWVLQQVGQVLALPQVQAAGYGLSANVSAMQFQEPDFFEKIAALIQKHGFNAQRLTLEVTESLLMSDVEGTIQKMVALHALGVQFAIDDFGTGYSSFAYLMKLPVQEIKMDQSFIRNLDPDAPSGAVVQAVLMVAKSQKLRVVAEGVEEWQQAQILQAWEPSLLCQGYLVSKPLPVEQWLQAPDKLAVDWAAAAP